jgi:tetratricopeptide (TPR) repeat protein
LSTSAAAQTHQTGFELNIQSSQATPKNQFNPGDIESLFWAGWIEIDHGDLDKAQTRLERVLKLAEMGDQAYYKYWARTGLGDIWEKRGDLKAALKSYSDSLAIRERLAQSDPGNAYWQYDLGISNERIGGVQEAQGDLAAALKSYEAKRDNISRLAQSDPGDAGWQRDLSVSYNKIGNVQMAQGDLKAALKSSDSLAIRERLANSDPGNAVRHSAALRSSCAICTSPTLS